MLSISAKDGAPRSLATDQKCAKCGKDIPAGTIPSVGVDPKAPRGSKEAHIRFDANADGILTCLTCSAPA